MTMHQPAMPAVPAAPAQRTDVGVPEDLTKQPDDANRAVEEASRRAGARAAAAAGQAANVGVVKNGTGQIIVTGPSGKTITIDPRAGLSGDQIQEMVQTALQPVPPAMRPDRGIPGELIPLAAIIFPCLVIMVTIVVRTLAGRRAIAGPTTAVLPPEAAARLARIEQAVEAVAIEVERISEAQRYSAQLLTDRLAGPATTAPAIAASRADHG